MAGWGVSSAAEAPLRIGLIASEAAGADALAAGARSAVAEVNASGGIDGRPLHLVRAAPARPWNGAGRISALVFQQDLIAVIGPEDGATAHTVAQIATRRRVPVITLAAEDSLTRALDPWVLRGVPDDETQALELLRFARDRGAGARLGLAVPPGRSGRERSRSLRRAAAVAGAQVACVFTPDAAAAALQTGELSCDAAQYDVLLLWLDAGPALELLELLDPNDLPQAILGSTRLDDTGFARALRELGASRAAGSVGSIEGRLLLPWLRSRSKSERDTPRSDAPLTERLGYDLLHAVADAARRAGTAGLPLREALRQTGSFAGSTGPFAFDAAGNRTGPLDIAAWHRDGWVALALDEHQNPRSSAPSRSTAVDDREWTAAGYASGRIP